MTNYPYRMQLVVDPDNPRNVVAAGSVSIYDSEDTGLTTLLALTDPSGVPIPNPITSNANGFTPPFVTTSPEVLWVSGPYTDYFQSYKGMRDEAVAAVAAAEAAAATAGAEAAAVAEAAIGTATDASTAAATAAAAAQADAEAAAQAAADAAALVGAPADTAIAAVVNNSASATKAALNATYATADAVARKLDGAPVTRTPRPLIVFTFDDGPKDDITVIKPILDAKGVKGSFAINSVAPGTSSVKLTWAEVRQLRDEGHEILDHSYSHANLSAADDALIAAQMDTSKATFLANGVTPSGFAWPYNSSGPLARKAARRLYPFAVGGTGGTTQPLHTYAIKRVPLNDGTTLATHQAQIDSAIANNELLVFISHSSTEMLTTGRALLGSVIDYAKSLSVPIVTAAEAFNMVGNIVDAGDLPGNVDYTVVDGQGRLKTSVAGTVAVGAINPTAAAAPNTYQAGLITVQRVSGPGNTDWPKVGGVGTIITNRIDTVSYQYTVQQFISDAQVIYTRRAASDTTWTAWETAGIGMLATTNTITPATTPVEFTAGKVTYSLISSANNAVANGWPAPGGAGSVITSRAGTSTTSSYATQTFIGPNGTTFTRRGVTDTTWTAWVGSGVMGSDAAAGNLTPDSFPLGTVMHTVPLSGSTGPSAKQGLLTTTRGSATIHTYTTQVFHEQGGGTMHRRMGLTATTWSAWKEITLV